METKKEYEENEIAEERDVDEEKIYSWDDEVLKASLRANLSAVDSKESIANISNENHNKRKILEMKNLKHDELGEKYDEMFNNNTRNRSPGCAGTSGVIDSPEKLWEYAKAYFIECETATILGLNSKGVIIDMPKPKPKSKGGLAEFIGVSTRWLDKLYRLPQYQGVFELIDEISKNSWVVMSATGQINPRIGEFVLSVIYGFQQKTVIEHTGNARRTVEQLAQLNGQNKLSAADDDVEIIDVTDFEVVDEDDDDE